MPHHRKHHEKRPSNHRKAILYAGAAGMMLLVIIVLIVPLSTRQHISWTSALLMAVGFWLISLFLGWLCIKSTRRRRKRRHSSRDHVGQADSYDTP